MRLLILVVALFASITSGHAALYVLGDGTYSFSGDIPSPVTAQFAITATGTPAQTGFSPPGFPSPLSAYVYVVSIEVLDTSNAVVETEFVETFGGFCPACGL